MPRIPTCERSVTNSSLFSKPVSALSDQRKCSALISSKRSHSQILSVPRPCENARASMLARSRSSGSWAPPLLKKLHKQRLRQNLQRPRRRRRWSRHMRTTSSRYTRRARRDAYMASCTKSLTRRTSYCIYWMPEILSAHSARAFWNIYKRRSHTSKLYL
jgi:hypothetical protein